MRVSDIHHVSINVTDVERAAAFYVDTLGFGVLDRPELGIDGRWLDVGSGRQVHLIGAEVPPDVGQHVAFQVIDLDATIDELRAAGIAVRGPFVVGPTRQAFLHDPDGNRLEINEPAVTSA